MKRCPVIIVQFVRGMTLIDRPSYTTHIAFTSSFMKRKFVNPVFIAECIEWQWKRKWAKNGWTEIAEWLNAKLYRNFIRLTDGVLQCQSTVRWYDVARRHEEIVYIAEDKSIYTTSSLRSKCVKLKADWCDMTRIQIN